MNVPRCPPASVPCAMTALQPAASQRNASATVVAVPITTRPSARSRAIAASSGSPNVNEMMRTSAATTASSCASKSYGHAPGATGGGSPNRSCSGAISASIAAGSTSRDSMPPANRFTEIGRSVRARIASTCSRMAAGVRYAAPVEPSAPAFEAAATRSGVS